MAQKRPRRKGPDDWPEQLEKANIQVDYGFKASLCSLVVDVPILRPRDQEDWTEQLRTLLPDGLRWCKAKRIVLNFDFSEKLETDTVIQTLSHGWLYSRWERLPERAVSSFLVCGNRPPPGTLAKFGYVASSASGVYVNTSPVTRFVELIVLDELGDESHNLTFKAFAEWHRANQQAPDPESAAALAAEMPYFLTLHPVQLRDE